MVSVLNAIVMETGNKGYSLSSISRKFELDERAMERDSRKISKRLNIQPICSLCENNCRMEYNGSSMYHCNGFTVSRRTIERYKL